MHGTVLGELLELLHQQETEEEQQQEVQGPIYQGAQDFLFSGLSGTYQAGKWRVI